MSKRKNMALRPQRDDLSENLIELKNELGLTYSELNIKLDRPCTPTTLRNITMYPGKPCSLKLYDKIQIGITNLKEYRTKKLELEQIKNELIYEITEITNRYHNKIESFYST